MPSRLLSGMAVALVSLPLIGILGSFFRRPYVVLPDSVAATAAFLPTGNRMLVATQEPRPRLYAYDLATKRIVWEREGSRWTAFTLSPRGQIAAVVERSAESAPYRLTVLYTADGRVALARELERRGPSHRWIDYFHAIREAVSVTDDGRWLALAHDDDAVEISRIPDGEVMARQRSGAVRQVSFDGAATRLAVYSGTPDGTHNVSVLAKENGEWAEQGVLAAAAWPTWAGDDLIVSTPRGLVAWRQGSERVVVPRQIAVEEDPERRPLRAVTPGGEYIAVANGGLCVLFDIKAARRLFSDSTGSGVVQGAVFHGSLLRAFLGSGDLVDVELSTGKIVKRTSYGKLGEHVKGFTTDGSSWEPAYAAFLSPDGTYLDLFRREEGHQILRLD